MTPDSIKAEYRRMLNEAGETVTIRRYTGTGASRPFFDADVLARVAEFQPDELIGGIIQGDVKLIVLADDLIEAQAPLDLRKGDKAVVRGRERNIEAADDNTRRLAGVLIAYELRVRG